MVEFDEPADFIFTSVARLGVFVMGGVISAIDRRSPLWHLQSRLAFAPAGPSILRRFGNLIAYFDLAATSIIPRPSCRRPSCGSA